MSLSKSNFIINKIKLRARNIFCTLLDSGSLNSSYSLASYKINFYQIFY